MNAEMIMTLLSVTGTLIGSISAICISNKLVIYRLEQLEKRLESLYPLSERITAAEQMMKDYREKLDLVYERMLDHTGET